jgi:hypothetical protein
MKTILPFSVLFVITIFSNAQVCTVSNAAATINWTNATAITCVEGGNLSTRSILRIPAGKTIVFDDNGDTWTGSTIEVFGTLTISAPGQVTINSNITVKSGGLLAIGSKLNLGSSSGCDYTIIIESGGTVDIAGGTPDRLNICGVEVARGGSAGCNSFPAGPLPYCEPSGGFTGPLDLGETGVLPIDLVYFSLNGQGNSIFIIWATSREENFDRFILEHSVNGVEFKEVAEITGAGYNTEDIIEYSYTHKVPKIGFNYYRLKAVDLDGTFEYFGPIGERFRGEQSLWIYPNPSAGDKITYEVNFAPNETDRVQLYNQMGALVADVPAVVHVGSVYLQEPLKPGAYVLRYTTPTEVLSARFIVLK